MTQLFDYTFIDNQEAKTLVLLHGTGGSKSDFLFLDRILNHSFNLLALQGNITEGNMARFFKRSAPGVFDQPSIKSEADKLNRFMSQWQANHDLQSEDVVYLGYSNGANMILATLFYFPASIHTAVLLHPMLPFTPGNISLEDKTLLVSAGESDPMVSPEQQKALLHTLEEKGTNLISKIYPGGHQLSSQEIQDVVDFLHPIAWDG